MLILDAWNVFKETGRVEDYLMYRNQSKDSVNINKADESPINQKGEAELGRTDNVNRDNIIGNADW